MRDFSLTGQYGSLGPLPLHCIGVSLVHWAQLYSQLYDIRGGFGLHIQENDAAILDLWIERLSLPE